MTVQQSESERLEVTAKKSKMTLEQFLQQFNTLDMQNYGAWPASVKLSCWLFIALMVLILGYFVAIQPKREAIDQAKLQQQNLLKDFREKDSKLRNLQQYREQLEQMEVSFQKQLSQLPKETEIPSLVESINETGIDSGLRFKNIRLETEIKQPFFIEQPISIEATGDFHAFGSFVSTLAALPRIVTLHDTVIEAQPAKEGADIPLIHYSLKAKTYRYISPEQQTLDKKTAEASS